jgi:hypothetical protein
LNAQVAVLEKATQAAALERAVRRMTDRKLHGAVPSALPQNLPADDQAVKRVSKRFEFYE